jgi:hypothetical protein
MILHIHRKHDLHHGNNHSTETAHAAISAHMFNSHLVHSQDYAWVTNYMDHKPQLPATEH